MEGLTHDFHLWDLHRQQWYFTCAIQNIYWSWLSGQTIRRIHEASFKICIFIAMNAWFSQGFNINGILKKIFSASNDFVKLNLWGLTLCPFSPGSPGSPSKPLSPCTDTQWGRMSTHQSQHTRSDAIRKTMHYLQDEWGHTLPWTLVLQASHGLRQLQNGPEIHDICRTCCRKLIKK